MKLKLRRKKATTQFKVIAYTPPTPERFPASEVATAGQAALLLRVSRRTISRYLEQGSLAEAGFGSRGERLVTISSLGSLLDAKKAAA